MPHENNLSNHDDLNSSSTSISQSAKKISQLSIEQLAKSSPFFRIHNYPFIFEKPRDFNKNKSSLDSLPTDILGKEIIKKLPLHAMKQLADSSKFFRKITLSLAAESLYSQRIKQVAATKYYLFLLTHGGDVYVSGYNPKNTRTFLDKRNKTNGSEFKQETIDFTKIPNLPKVVYISVHCWKSSNPFSADDSVLYTTANGEVWVTGELKNYIAGVSRGNLMLPEKVPGLPPIKEAIMGMCHSAFFITAMGDVYACGQNYAGQLGLGDTTEHSTPKKIHNLPPIKQIKNKHLFSYQSITQFLTCDGTVYYTGGDNYGLNENNSKPLLCLTPQLLPNLTNITQLVSFNSKGAAYLTDDYRVINYNMKKKILNNSMGDIESDLLELHFQSITIDKGDVFYITTDNELFVAGSNNFNRAGVEVLNPFLLLQRVQLDNVTQTASTKHCTVFLDKQGNVYGCGSNQNSALGAGVDNKTIFNKPFLLPYSIALNDKLKCLEKLTQAQCNASLMLD